MKQPNENSSAGTTHVNGDPSPMSPDAVEKDSDYDVMREYEHGHYWPSAEEIIVRHRATDTFWRAVYQVRADDDDSHYGANWQEVSPSIVSVTRYTPVRRDGSR